MHVERMTRMIDLLRGFKPTVEKDFYINLWKKETACGTVVCACGLATEQPYFASEGLMLVQIREGDEFTHRGSVITSMVDDLILHYDGKWAIEAAAAFFDIDYEEANSAFTTSGYLHCGSHITAKHVATKLQHYLDRELAATRGLESLKTSLSSESAETVDGALEAV